MEAKIKSEKGEIIISPPKYEETEHLAIGMLILGVEKFYALSRPDRQNDGSWYCSVATKYGKFYLKEGMIFTNFALRYCHFPKKLRVWELKED